MNVKSAAVNARAICCDVDMTILLRHPQKHRSERAAAGRCTGASIHGRDPTTEWQGGFDLLSLRLGPVHPTLDDLVVPGCPRRTISIPNLAWMPDQHSPRQLRASELNRSSSLSPLGLGLQVVWGSSYKVGCAAQLCPNGVRNFDTREGVVFVCNYATAGNMNAERPYESDGEACSGCEGSCVDRLCRYSWTPDMDQALPAADHHYVYILVVRPICLILTFIASYAVHCFYPDVFCYE
ncbi:hypothetical protein F2P81_018524 [Scophthalmus maximus]|uniref:4Fe-4S ferredoxin-type domain-containing protein n=1 Tax=Scophthalmus maximus TaxID=52904 RepID=A0A6A4SA16_SCOMX|nr:hypothetical protein F2P81_018524 [Scophthalmus maximus]